MRLPFRRKPPIDSAESCRCPNCKAAMDVERVLAELHVCPHCQYHFFLPSRERIASLIDEGTFEPLEGQPVRHDPLAFEDRIPYAERLAREREETGLDEAALAGAGQLHGRPVVVAATDIEFLRGSVGVVAGERITAAAELATDLGRPLVIVSNSVGGARIHEGAFALMQMAKTSAALSRFSERGGLFISILANPTMGGVMASFPALGDIILAEPGAMAGLTGPSIIRETVKRDLPPGFQTAEYLLEHGLVDAVVHRADLATTVARLVDYAPSRSET